MTRSRFSAALSLVLLALLAICVGEASLFAVLAAMSGILGLGLRVDVGPAYFQGARWTVCGPQVTLFNAATVGSFLFTGTCGIGAAMAKFRGWQRPA